MTATSDQVLPDRQLRGRQPPARPRAALGAGRRAAHQRDHLRPPRLPGLRRGARRALRARRRDARHQRRADRRQRDRLPRGVLHAVPGDLVAAAVDPLAVRQRARGRHRHRRGAARPRAATTCASSARAATAAPWTSASAACRGCSSATTTCSTSATTTRRYMNTGVQRSGATPPAARTATTQAVGAEPGQRVRPGQERAADRDGARDPLRRHRHRRRPARPRGQGRDARWRSTARATSTSSSPARSAGAAPPTDTIRVARLATETGLFPVFEAERRRGHRRDEDPPPGAGRGVPEARSSASRTCSRRAAATDVDRPHPGAAPTATSRRFGLLDDETGERLMDKPFAITLDVGSSLANKTGSWRDRAPGLRRTACRRATTPARPARTSRAGSTTPRTATTRPPGASSWRTTRCPRSWAGSATTRARPPATARQLDEAVGINAVERFLGDEAIKQGWKLDADGAADRQARARRRRRARRACPPPITWPASATR